MREFKVSNYQTIYKEIEVDVDLADFDTEDLIEELNSRNASELDTNDSMHLLKAIYQKKRLGVNFDSALSELVYITIGKIL